MATAPKLKVEIITAERIVYSAEQVDEVIVPGAEGELAILPRHAALISGLGTGELVVMKGNDEEHIALAGGFMEVLNNTVTILSDVAEREEEIDLAAAQAARDKAREALETASAEDYSGLQAALAASLARLRVAERRRRRGGRGGVPGANR
ncbi:MAG: F0F1 ATP synthase subunit epsilon [Dehalococcoidia bacterium]|nr:F0F1 ATP synthase subunit epsilon [Dehalococcoidia bacterium]